MEEIENNTVEWKEFWDREWLKGMSAFATFNGGTYLIGVKDDGECVGITDPKNLMKLISDMTRNILHFTPISTYANLRQPTPTYANLRQPTPTYANLRQPTPVFLNLSQPLSTSLNLSRPRCKEIKDTAAI